MLRISLILSLFALLYSCSGDQDEIFTIIEDPDPLSETEARADLFIRVIDEAKQPISGAQLSLNGFSGTTNAEGFYLFPDHLLLLRGLELVVTAPGYVANTTRILAAPGGTTGINIVLLGRGNLGTYDSSLPININDEESVSWMRIEANSLQTLDGEPYNGQVEAFIRYLDPEDADFVGLQPAGMRSRAIDGSLGQLASFGMFYFEVRGENGEQLRSNADIRMGIEIGNNAELAPSSIDVWSLVTNDTTWRELPIDAVSEGRTYYCVLPAGCCFGSLSGWINCDIQFPSEAAIFKATDLNGVPYRQVVAKVVSQSLGIVYNSISNNLGEAALLVPLDEDFGLQLETQCGDFIANFQIVAADLDIYNTVEAEIPDPNNWWQLTFSGEDCSQTALTDGFVITSNSFGYYTLSQLGADGNVDVLVPKCNDLNGFTATGYLDVGLTQAGAPLLVSQPGFQESISLTVCP